MPAAGPVTAANTTHNHYPERTRPTAGLTFLRRVEAVGLSRRPGTFGMTMPLNPARMASGEADLSKPRTVAESGGGAGHPAGPLAMRHARVAAEVPAVSGSQPHG